MPDDKRAKFVQIATAVMPETAADRGLGGDLYLYALDENGDVWHYHNGSWSRHDMTRDGS